MLFTYFATGISIHLKFIGYSLNLKTNSYFFVIDNVILIDNT